MAIYFIAIINIYVKSWAFLYIVNKVNMCYHKNRGHQYHHDLCLAQSQIPFLRMQVQQEVAPDPSEKPTQRINKMVYEFR